MTKPDAHQIQQEIAVAWETLQDAESALQKSRLRTAVSRGYYAMFHAARAALLCYGLGSKSHKGLIGLFGQHLVKTGLVSQKLGDAFTDAHDSRDSADYNVMTGSFDQAGVAKLITDARAFVEQMDAIVQDTTTKSS